MIKASVSLQDLRRRIYVTAKAEPAKRFWGLYVHVCKRETLYEAFAMAKANDGSPGSDGITFEAIEENGVEEYLKQIRDELIQCTYRPSRLRRVEIPKDNGKTRTLSIPTIRDRVVQGALKLILEPIFEADFQPGSYGYRPKRTAHQALDRVAKAIAQGKTHVIDLDLKAYFDNVKHDILLEKVARRVSDDHVMHLLREILKGTGKQGVPQGGVLSPLLSNIYLNEVDQMLEKAKEVTGYRRGPVEYARYADDLVVLVAMDQWRSERLRQTIPKRLREELAKIKVEVNEEKSRTVDLVQGGSFGFLGFDFKRVRSRKGTWYPRMIPKMKKRTALLWKLRSIFRSMESRPVEDVISRINPILRGWVNYFRIGQVNRMFAFVRNWVRRKVKRHLMRAQGLYGIGWHRITDASLAHRFGLFMAYPMWNGTQVVVRPPFGRR